MYKDDLLPYFISGKVRLNKSDYSFVSNIYTKLNRDSVITTNQAALFDKILLKYKRQLINLSLGDALNNNLQWKVNPIETDVNYLIPKVSLSGDTLLVKVSFHREIVNSYHNLFDEKAVWNKELKHYEIPFRTKALSNVMKSLEKHFKEVSYDQTLAPVIMYLKSLSVYTWNPTLVVVNNRLYVIAANEPLIEATSDLPLDVSIHTLYAWSEFGVNMHNDHFTFKQRVAGSRIIQIDQSTQFEETMDCLAELNIKALAFDHTIGVILHKKWEESLRKRFTCYTNTQVVPPNTPYVYLTMRPMMFRTSEIRHHSKKIISFTNTDPIIIK